MYKTHIVFAIFLYLLLTSIFHIPKNFYVALIVALGSLLPDIDSGKSYINRKMKFGKLIAYASKHRGFWHSVFGLLFIFILSLILFSLIKKPFFSLYLSLGYFSHLIADSLTLTGIKPLWKLSKFEIKGKIKTSGFFEYILFFLLLISIAYLLFPSQIQTFTSYVIKIFR